MVGRRLSLCALGLAGAIGVALPHAAAAHPGGLNAEGCHNDRKRGGYHCHRAPSAGASRTAPAALFSGRAFPNCSAARAAGAAPIRRGEPGYGPHLDRDGDGVACETGGGGRRNLEMSTGGTALGLLGASSGYRRPAITRSSEPSSGRPDPGLDGLALAERVEIVRRLQIRLASEGYDPGTADGRIGPRTRAALAQFQAATDLPGTGLIDAPTLAALSVAAEDEADDADLAASGAILIQPIWLRRPSAHDLARLYPDQAQRAGVGGDVVLDCLVAASGEPRACEVISETPEGHGFGGAAIDLARRYRAKVVPAQAGARVRLPISFRLPG